MSSAKTTIAVLVVLALLVVGGWFARSRTHGTSPAAAEPVITAAPANPVRVTTVAPAPVVAPAVVVPPPTTTFEPKLAVPAIDYTLSGKVKPSAEATRQRLDAAKLTVVWDKVRVIDALRELSARSGVTIALAAESQGRAATNSIEMLHLDTAVSAAQILDLVTQLKGLAWQIEGDHVVIVMPGVVRDMSAPEFTPSAWIPPAPPAPTGPIAKALAEKRVTFEFAGAQADTIVRSLSAVLGKDIVIDPAVAKQMQDTPVALRLQDVSIATALKYICKLVPGVTYEVDEKAGVVTIKAVK